MLAPSTMPLGLRVWDSMEGWGRESKEIVHSRAIGECFVFCGPWGVSGDAR